MSAAGAALPSVSPRLLGLFHRHVRRYLGRHFHAVRLARAGGIPAAGAEPLVVYLNHPSWWDPLVAMAIALEAFPERHHRAVMDARSLAGYRFFRRLGFVGVEAGTLAGARDFVRLAVASLGEPRGSLWLTPQGRFADPRERPASLRPGLAHLATLRAVPRGTVFVPLALELPFWDAPYPEALARFGEPVTAARLRELPAAAAAAVLTARLESAQDRLATDARARDARHFDTVVPGRGGAAGFYHAWRRLRAGLAGGEAGRAGSARRRRPAPEREQ